MDRRELELPLDLDAARIRLLYRIPIVPARGRALDLNINGVSLLGGGNWAGEFAVVNVSGTSPPLSSKASASGDMADRPAALVADYAQGLPFSDGSIDVVVLHRTLDRLAALARREGRRFDMGDFLSHVARVLAAGGLVIGCVENRYGLERFLHGANRLFGRAIDVTAGSDAARPLSVIACHRVLAAAGFEDIRLFSMLPSPDAPSQLMSIERGWARRACRRQVEALRPLVGPVRYRVWRALAELGISQYLGDATFFWGRKGC